ncbi:F0F1 ATP synthase subunit B [Candidatus Kaiserbacteria bacterium]|nr:F0F1 ATP synthase subunit B [Candidatus Kaiserbacteria bacterium]
MSELLHNFGVDWKLLLSQVVNFAILFFLLKKFAYQPILAILRKRRETIAEGLVMREEAERTLGEIETLKAKSITEAQEEALAVVKRAEETAVERKDEIIGEATARGEILISEAKQKAGKEVEKMEAAVLEEAEVLVREGIKQVLRRMPAGERDEELIRGALSALKSAKV